MNHPAPYIETLTTRLAAAGPATVLRHAGQDIAASELLASINRYARAMAGIGIGPGSLMALFAPNHPDALAIRYGAHLTGAATVYLSAPDDPQRRAQLVEQLAPTWLVAFPDTAHLVPESAAARLAAVGGDMANAALRLDELAAVQPDGPFASRARPDDLAVIISSGGTTGVPKGSRRHFAAYTALVGMPSPTSRRQLVNGRLAYLSQVLVDVTLLGGGCVVLQDVFAPASTLAAIEAERITDLFLVEPQLFALMDHPDVARRDLSSLRSLNHIGASAPAVLRLRARERLGPVLAHTYGASEMGLVSLLPAAEHDPRHPDRFSCAGRILPSVAVRFRRADGSLAPAGDTGVIEVRSPGMAQGYRNRPEQEAAAFRDGWYETGDLGYLDAAGFLHIQDRASDMVPAGNGRMVGPAQLQDTLCRLPGVRYAVVVPGDQPGHWVAAVASWPGVSLDIAACHAAVWFAHDVPASVFMVVPCQSIPLTEQGKPDRAAIRAMTCDTTLPALA